MFARFVLPRKAAAGLVGAVLVLTGCSDHSNVTGLKAGGRSAVVVILPTTATCAVITAVDGIAITPVTLVASGGVSGPYTFTAVGLPAGLTISTDGTISGTPTVSGTFTYTVSITDAYDVGGGVTCSITVAPPVTANGFTTYTQGGWGAVPHGGNAGYVLTKFWSLVYSGGSVNVGGIKMLTFTSANAITVFLPQGGTPSVLTSSATNATRTAAGEFAGQVLSLRLSVDFSAAGFTKGGLGGLRLLSGKLAGQTVSQVLALANAVLGGNLSALPAGMSLSDLNTVITALNENYDGGTANLGYLGT